jgi:hypothetical protein
MIIASLNGKLLGEAGEQHAMEIKLMTYFDGDPIKPMRVEVHGSSFYVV